MVQTTDEKLEKLGQLFPQSDKEGLLDVIVSCNGSLKRSAQLLGLEDEDAVSASICGNVKRFKSQQTLSRFMSPSARSIPATARLSPHSHLQKTIELHTKHEIEVTLKYCTYHTDVLPQELAEELLRTTMNDPSYKASQFYLFGNKCTSNHKSRLFLPAARSDAFYYNGKEVKDFSLYSDEMMLAQVLIEDVVNQALTQRPQLSFQINPGQWEAQAALSNLYESNSNLDWHSDRLTTIGPHAVIASLSLGFSRDFRVRKTYPSNSQVYSIKPKHNSLIIMHAGFQEEYKHCVPLLPKKYNIPTDDLHILSQAKRVNITYRNYLFKETAFCKQCGSPMDLRRMFKDARKRGKYFYQCTKSYTADNGFKDGKECKWFAYANFENGPSLTDDEDHCSTWLADDDVEAKEAQRIE
ncbi:LANO_0G00430g1_1 [Lachancea nothofagi CBS 11611]|uniref:LANO_0G00430g1_1 n=1 Tax=Lachancea nothofagi CBS 11611 TaxID=1266666 RepID=A0A1G4KEB1_9SACH|nr:LANO_0G00430g1_1 [Lachancea nothofagi CBS 11611]